MILYMMLSGKPPFNGPTEKAILEKIEIGYACLSGMLRHLIFLLIHCPRSGPDWKHISNEAKLLISQMLKYEPSERLSAIDALENTWFKIFGPTHECSAQKMRTAVRTLVSFKVQR